MSDYYITPKYDNFKNEIMNYRHIHFITDYQNQILKKATIYMETSVVKSMVAVNGEKYGIAFGEKISLNHLISVIMYTDYTELSSDFTSTFRKQETWELLSSIKRRNAKYAWWSRYLMETVQAYGESAMGGCDDCNKSGFNIYGDELSKCITEGHTMHGGKLKCPLYCGMSRKINMPQFAISLLSPTSTTRHISVATNFSGEDGIIIEFGNYTYPAQCTIGFDVSFISRYKEEDERYIQLFIYSPSICILLDCY